MLSHNLTNILVCPACKNGLITSDIEQILNCHTCGLSFPIIEGIPVMIVGEAQNTFQERMGNENLQPQ